ncbi:hypothetical protein ACPCHT_04175 [Nucisporomicrobium flavum]|uniref:hypothetical protein n=1 Tax=Nucisporomicrobium flavum TaxID=2785915 RepID=UPI003C2F5888
MLVGKVRPDFGTRTSRAPTRLLEVPPERGRLLDLTRERWLFHLVLKSCGLRNLVLEGCGLRNVAPERGRLLHLAAEGGRLRNVAAGRRRPAGTTPGNGRRIGRRVLVSGAVAAARALFRVRDVLGPARPRAASVARGFGLVVLGGFRRGDAGAAGDGRLGLRGLAAAAAGAGRFVLLLLVPERRGLDAAGALGRDVAALCLPVGGVEFAVVVLELVEVEAADRPAVHAGRDGGGVEVRLLEVRVVQPARAFAVERGLDLLVAVGRTLNTGLPSLPAFRQLVDGRSGGRFWRTGMGRRIVEVIFFDVLRPGCGAARFRGFPRVGTPAGENGGIRVRITRRSGRVRVRHRALVVVLRVPVLVVLVAHRPAPARHGPGYAEPARCRIRPPVLADASARRAPPGTFRAVELEG